MLNTFNLDGDKKNVCFKKKILKYFVTNGNSTIQELAKEINLSIPTISKQEKDADLYSTDSTPTRDSSSVSR